MPTDLLQHGDVAHTRSEEAVPVQKPIFTPTIDAGHILQAGIMIVAAVLYFAAVSGKADDANRKIDELKVVVDRGLTDLGNKITALPDYAARLTQAERRIAEGDAHTSAVDNRMTGRLDELGARLTHDEIAASAFEARLTRIEGASGPLRNPR